MYYRPIFRSVPAISFVVSLCRPTSCQEEEEEDGRPTDVLKTDSLHAHSAHAPPTTVSSVHRSSNRAIVSIPTQHRRQHHLSIRRSGATDIIMPQYGDDDFEECEQATDNLYEHHADLSYDWHDALTTIGHGWSNLTMTETGLSQLYDVCQTVYGRFAVVDTAVMKCNDEDGIVRYSAYTNMGYCFPNNPACDSYTVVSFLTNASTSSWCGEILTSCQVFSDVPRTTYVPQVLSTPSPTTSSSRFGPPEAAANVPTSPHSDVRLSNCLQSQKSYFDRSHKLDENVFLTYHNSQVHTYGKGFSLQSFGIDEQTAYRRECEAEGGRFVTFTGTLDCVYADAEYPNSAPTMTYSYQNYGDCFPPQASSQSGDGACDVYSSAAPWLIDFVYVWEDYACTVRKEEEEEEEEEEEGIEGSAAVAVGGGSTVAVPPPSVFSSTSSSATLSSTASVPGPSSSSLSSNRTGKGPTPPPPPSLHTTTTATNGGGFAVGAAVLLLAVFVVGTIIHRRRQHKWTRTLTGDDIDDDMELQDLDLASSSPSSVGPTVAVSRIS